MASVPRYVQILRALQDCSGPDYLHLRPQTPEGYYNWLIPCTEKETKENIKKKLCPYMPAELDFEATPSTVHVEEEQGTQWALFAGSGSVEMRESIWPLIIQKLKTSGEDTVNANHFNYMETDFLPQWLESDKYIFHLVVLCSPLMKKMAALIQAGDATTLNEKYFLEQQHQLNAAGLPCVHIAAQSGRLEIVKHLLNLNPGCLNQTLGEEARTVLHSAVAGADAGVITFLLQEVHGIDQTLKNIFNRTPFHSTLYHGFRNVQLLYDAMNAEEKSAMSGCDLLHEAVTSLRYTSLERVFEIITLISGDSDFNWGTQSYNPYVAAMDLFREMGRWLTNDARRVRPSTIAYCENLKKAAVSTLHKLNDNLVPLRYYNDHGSTAILLLFEYAPVEILQAILESLPKRRQQRGEVLICSSVDLDGDTSLTVAAWNGPEILKVAETWRDHDMKPEILQHFIHHKDFRQAAELLLVQERFEEALKYLELIEQNDWTRYMCAAAYIGLRDYQQAQRIRQEDGGKASILRLKSRIALGLERRSEFIEINRAAYAEEVEWGREHEKVKLQRELCEEVLKSSVLPPEIKDKIAKHLAE